MTHLTLIQWLIAACAALLFGVAKIGLPSVALLGIALFTLIIPAREASGATLPLLIVGDIIAVAMFRQHVLWPQLARVFPWAAFGVVVGYFALGQLDDQQVRYLIGGLVTLLTMFQYVRQRATAVRSTLSASSSEMGAAHPLVTVSMGVSAGFATMVANASGPIMVLYLLAMRLPKLAFIGTSVWFFLFLNLFKVPFSAQLGLISTSTLWVDLVLVPFVVLGALGGRWLVTRVSQVWFERIALLFALVAGLRLLFS